MTVEYCATPLPEDVEPNRFARFGAGLALIAVGVLLFFPITMIVYYDGVASLLHMPALFNWLAGISASFWALGLYSMRVVNVGAELRFQEGGFRVRVRQYFRAETRDEFDWSEVQEIHVADAAYNNGGIGILGKDGRFTSFPMRFVAITAQSALARLRLSAEQSGFRLERTGGFNVGIIARDVWSVTPAH